MHIHELLTHAVNNNASDLHISAGEVPMMRVLGDMQRLNAPILSQDETKRLIYSVLNERQKMTLEKELEIDFSIGLKGLSRFRVNVFNQSRGLGAVFRRIPFEIVSLDRLGFPPVVSEFAKLPRGLVLVTGPTGSGKSTTLAALVDLVNTSEAGHIITVEDPVEFHHKPKKSLINQRELGLHTHSFNNALRSALRQDPDVILIGELRDLETISLALTAAETGHLVFATLHTKSAPETIDRIIDVFPEGQQAQVRTMVAECLRAVVAQILIRSRQGNRRVVAYEIMVVNPAVRNLIREGKVFQIPSIMQSHAKDGMVTLEACLKEHALKGRITRDEAIETSGNPNLFGLV